MTNEEFNKIYAAFDKHGEKDKWVFAMTHDELREWGFELVDGKWIDTEKQDIDYGY